MIDYDIPGFKNTEERQFYELIALKNIHAKNVIIIGSGWGCEAYIFAKTIPDCHVYCIDNFCMKKPRIINEQFKDAINTPENFYYYMRNCNNIELIIENCENWDYDFWKNKLPKADILVYDAEDIDSEIIQKNFSFWFDNFLKKGGVLMGHDYFDDSNSEKCAIKEAVDEYAKKYNMLFELDTLSWMLTSTKIIENE